MKKALMRLCEEINNMTNDEAKEYMRQILRSFQLQVAYGIAPVEAFLNSINRPTMRKSKKHIEAEKREKLNKLKKKQTKMARLLKYRDEILFYRKQRLSLRQIAELLKKQHRLKVSYQTVRRIIIVLEK